MTEGKPSKSERKREQHRLQSLGEQLLRFSAEQLAELALEERLLDALSEAHKIKSHEALRRHKQYIGKLMRDVDPQPIQAALDADEADERASKRRFAAAEKWRDRLLREGIDAARAFCDETGNSDAEAELTGLLTDLDRANSDRKETELKRRLFRRLHDALVVAADSR